MAKILLAWELGNHAGHIMGLLPIAYRLRELGHEVAFAVKQLTRIPPEHRQAFQFWQCPQLVQQDNKAEKFGYADILVSAICPTGIQLRSLVDAWLSLLAASDADLVVAEHAPTALLAARASGRDWLALGTGFTCPPSLPGHAPMPGFTQLDYAQRRDLSASEARVLASCNQVLGTFGAPTLHALGELFEPVRTLLCTYPELDHYGLRPGVDYYGPLYSEVQTSAPQWPARYTQNIFVYVNDFRDWTALAAALQLINANILVVAIGLPEADVAACSAPHLMTTTAPVALTQALQRCDLYIGHGGLGVTAQALSLGKPMILMPTQKEQLMLAKRLVAQNLGAYVLQRFTADTLVSGVSKVLSDSHLHRAVAGYAARHRETLSIRVERIAQRIDEAAVIAAASL